MAKDEIIQFKKTLTYEMPEENWNDGEAWYENVYENIFNLNSMGQTSNIDITSRFAKTKDKLLSALNSRIDNKNNPYGDYGYGKCMKEIIGEYHISLDDKEGYERKVNILSEILDIFNQDSILINYDPLEEGEQKLIFKDNITPEEATIIALKVIGVQNPKKINVGGAMGFISNNFPHLKSQMSQIAPLVAQSINEVRNKINKEGTENIKIELEKSYPSIFTLQEAKGPKKLEEPISYIFKYDDIEPLLAYYQIGDEVYEIPLAELIKRMKHDKAAYNFLNQNKPGGPLWPEMAGTDYYLVISNDPFMNMTKSSGRFWEQNSCERYDSYDWTYAKGPMTDVLYGNCVVFAFEGGKLPHGWPQIQPTNRTSSEAKNTPGGGILGRQNIKWGYKENVVGDIGMGLDPTLYPRGGAVDKLLTKTLATILSTTSYFNYNQMRTPYYYDGHCDVGSGTGNLTYSRGNGCITDIKAPKVNPDVIMASNENIGYVAFERLTRPIIDKNVKMILAQNPNIWAIAGNETGIGRLIRTKDLDIVRFLVASETADPHALLGIVNIIPEVDPTWEDISARSSLPFLIANHQNSTPEVHKRLLELHPGYIFEGKSYDAIEVLYGGIGYDNTSNMPYVCNGDLVTIQKLLKKIRTKGKKNKAILSKSLLFAPHAGEEEYLKALHNIQEGIELLRRGQEQLSLKILQEVALSYALPLTYSESWAFDDNPYGLPFSISHQRDFIYVSERQVLKATDVVMSISHNWSKEIIQSLRDRKCFNSIWRQRKKYNIPSYLFTKNSRDILDFNKPSPQILYGARQLITTLHDGEYGELRHSFDNDGVQYIREDPNPSFVSEILKDISLIENMGWGLVALWLSEPVEHFGAFIELIYQKSFNGLYLGDGKFADLPDSPFELYRMAQDIAVLEESAIDMVFDEGGMARNVQIPYAVQNQMVGDWVYLSHKYGGSYGEYLDNIYGALSVNPNLDKNLLNILYEMESYHKELSLNPNTPIKYLFTLFEEYPSEVLSNPALNPPEFSNLWNLCMDVLSTMTDENPNRLFDSFRINSVLERNKGYKIRSSLKTYLQENNWVKYWRGGTTKKGNFKTYFTQNLYTEGIADYPIIPTQKSIVVKFSDNPDEYLTNQIYYLDKIEKIDEYNILIEGRLTSWGEDSKRKEEEISERVNIDDFFNYIPDVEREESREATNSDGEAITIQSPRWTVDNIFVFTDIEVFEDAANLPKWRFNFSQEDAERIIQAYLIRGCDVQELLNFLETPITTPDYTLNQDLVWKNIEFLSLWDKTLIDKNLENLLHNGGNLFTSFKNLPLTKKVLGVSLVQNEKEFEELFDIHSMSLADLPPIQTKILKFTSVPISYVYAIINSSLDPLVLAQAKKIRAERPLEYVEHYRKIHPAVTRS